MNLPLNDEQLTAVNLTEGPIVCISGPGSGKTTVIVERYLNLLSKGVLPSQILTLTFTSAAAKEMSDRAGFSDMPVFRTFHSYALALLKKERALLPFELTPDIIPLPNDVYKTIIHLLHTYQALPSYKSLAEGIASFKHRGLTPEQAREESYSSGKAYLIASAYRDYEKMCRSAGWLDFDSIMFEAVQLLGEQPECRARNQVEFLQVDEGQDTDRTQFELLRLLTKKNIFVVGDENQLIYEWRSAMPGSLSQLSQKFSGSRTIYLGTNYRSTHSIVKFLKEILPVDNGLASHMKPADHSPEGVAPTITKYDTEMDESIEIISRLTEPEKTAILVRTNRQIELFRLHCIRKNIKFHVLGKSGFWDQSEVKKLMQLVKESRNTLGHLHAAEAVTTVIQRSAICEKYRTQLKFGETDPQENINGVTKVAAQFNTLPEFLSYVNKAMHASRNRGGLTLSTVHQMKGKEADHVFLAGACQGLLPHANGELPEERRIFYVACSRAARFLHISYYGQPSMFLLPFLEGTMTVRDIPGAQQALF